MTADEQGMQQRIRISSMVRLWWKIIPKYLRHRWTHLGEKSPLDISGTDGPVRVKKSPLNISGTDGPVRVKKSPLNILGTDGPTREEKITPKYLEHRWSHSGGKITPK